MSNPDHISTARAGRRCAPLFCWQAGHLQLERPGETFLPVDIAGLRISLDEEYINNTNKINLLTHFLLSP